LAWKSSRQRSSLGDLVTGSLEPGGHEVIFQGYYQGSNLDQYRGISRPHVGNRDYHRYMDGPIISLPRDQRAVVVA
jgi:hypothetical protein